METPLIETNRLILKRGSLEDYQKVYEYDMTRLRNINGEFEFVKNDPNKLVGYDTYADEEEMCIDFILYLKDNMIPIGNITYDRYDESNKSLEISYNLHPNYWRNGYTTEAIIESIKYVFTNCDIDNIRCEYAEDNFKSKLLAKKIGFKEIGSHLEHYNRINKDINEILTIISKDEFFNKYK